MKIEIWSDFACPYCYIGKKKLEKALEEFKCKEKVEITFKTFQLNPFEERKEISDYSEHLSKKYNIPYAQAKVQVDGMINSAAELGLNLRYDILIRNKTTLAHEITKYAKTVGKEIEIANCFFKGYFEKGADLGDVNTLFNMCKKVGLDIEKLKKVIEEESYLPEILKDRKEASSIGITGVPFFIINDKITISGAQSIEYFKMALKQAEITK
ncbi:MAG: DsbA family oxidoreductase [Fusobacterium sp.]